MKTSHQINEIVSNKKNLSTHSIIIQSIEDNKIELVRKILQATPSWFNTEPAITDYLEEAKRLPTYFALDQDGNPIGFACLKVHNQYTGEIYIMAVLPQYQGKGIGTKLIEYCEARVKGRGCNYIMVKTLGRTHLRSYQKICGFFMNNGFSPLAEFTSIWTENPCLIMVKNLFSIRAY